MVRSVRDAAGGSCAKIECDSRPYLVERKCNGVDPPNAVAQVDAIGVKEIVEGKYGLTGIRLLSQDLRTARSGQQTAGNGWRSPNSLFDHEDVVPSAFGEFTSFIEEQGVVTSGISGRKPFLVVAVTIRCFMEEKTIVAGNHTSGNPHAAEPLVHVLLILQFQRSVLRQRHADPLGRARQLCSQPLKRAANSSFVKAEIKILR